jgi:pimeloyl-ACP methyl ester carboxylesterase
MRPLLKIATYTAIGIVALLVLAVGALLSLRAWSQHSNANEYAIRSAHGINESRYVRIGGIDQWIQIRGQDRDNPVLLILHGGPGATLSQLTRFFIPWEKEFTVVQWDQRGAGKTLKSTGASIAATMSVERMTQDGLEVAEHVRTHLHKDKIILLGHSWGSILGINMVKRKPGLFYAYVGTGQASDMPRSLEMAYAQLMQQAQAASDRQTTQALKEAGPPPFDSRAKLEVFFSSIDKYQPPSDRAAMKSIGSTLLSPPPDYSLRDVMNWYQGFRNVPTLRIYNEMQGTRLTALGPDFEVPIVFIQGTEDNVTQARPAAEYFASIVAPHKEMVLLDGGGHFAFLSMSDRFLKELTSRVRPFAKRPAS